jgi:hypothetical protein
MAGLASWYAALICPLSPVARTLIIAVVAMLALAHIRLMYAIEAWIRRERAGRTMAAVMLGGAGVDAAIVAAFALLQGAAEAHCPVAAAWPVLRVGILLACAAAMALFALILLVPHLRRGSSEAA